MYVWYSLRFFSSTESGISLVPAPRYQLWFPRRENLVGEELPAGGINDEATHDFSSFDIALELENADGNGDVMNRGEFLHYLEHLLPWSESREYCLLGRDPPLGLIAFSVLHAQRRLSPVPRTKACAAENRDARD